jgi:hypothetical protein
MGAIVGLTLREERRLRLFENCVMRKLCDLYSPGIFRIMKSRRMTWASHVARMGDGDFVQDFGGET